MKRISSFFLLVVLFAGVASAQQMNWNKIDPSLEYQLRERPDDFIKVTVFFEDQVDIPALVSTFGRDTDIHARRVAVVSALKAKAEATQQHVLPFIESLDGVQRGSIKSHWISNDIRAYMRYEAIEALSQREEVGMLVYELPKILDDAEAASNAPYMPSPESVGGREPGLDVINAPALWAMGYTGIGKKVLIIDSGVTLDHPALRRNYYGNNVGDNLAWYNPGGLKAPFDCDEHGSHVTGVTVGMQLSNRDTFGVAINSQWMGSPAIDGGVGGNCPNDVDDQDAMQWALDPDGNTMTTDDMPDVINGSYGTEPQFFSSSSCISGLLKQRMEALEAASVTFVQSAGNYGPGDSTMGGDKNMSVSIVNSFTVAAVNGGNVNLPVMSYSSRGPSRCDLTGSLKIKPEVAAPGHNVRSAVPGGGFKLLPGTSFSAPHVAGAALLLHEAFPAATAVDVKEALYFSAVDYGAPGEDNNYGRGVIDVLAAFNYLVAEGFTAATVSRDKDALLAEVFVDNVLCGTDVTPDIVIENNGKTTMTSATVEYVFSDGTTGSYSWTGSLAPGATEMVSLPTVTLPIGHYDLDVEITTVDGQADYYNIDNVGEGSFSLLGDDTPIVTNTVANPAAVCSGASAVLTASGNSANRVPAWYADPAGNTLLFVGENFITDALTTSKAYYVGSVGQEYVGMTDREVGSNFPSFNINSYLEFDLYTDVTIKSVLIYASSLEARVIQIVDLNGQLQASQPTGLLTMGANRIPLGFSLPAGTYRMQLGGAFSGLSATIGNISFPYEVPGVMSIIESDNGFYNYFYDWEVEYAGACDLVQAFAAVAPGAANAFFSADKQFVDLTVDGDVTFTNNSAGAATYLWDFGDGTTSTDINPVHTYTTAGNYLVTLEAKASAGCTDADSTTIVVDGVLSLGDLESNYGTIEVFPNPSNGLFSLSLNLNKAYEVEIEVLNLVGQTVWKQAAESTVQQNKTIDLTELTDGVYTLKIHLDGVTVTEKLVMTR